VYGVFLLELASIIMVIYDMYRWFVSGFGSILALGNVQLSSVDTPMMGSFVAAIVQMFYCYRIYMINEKAWGVSVVVALVRVFFFYLDAIVFDVDSVGISRDCRRSLWRYCCTQPLPLLFVPCC
jgi:hypothetical protein